MQLTEHKLQTKKPCLLFMRKLLIFDKLRSKVLNFERKTTDGVFLPMWKLWIVFKNISTDLYQTGLKVWPNKTTLISFQSSPCHTSRKSFFSWRTNDGGDFSKKNSPSQKTESWLVPVNPLLVKNFLGLNLNLLLKLTFCDVFWKKLKSDIVERR